MIHASLFSGIGGFDLAAEWMGWKNAFHCEINPWCAKVLQYHFPNSKHYADITATDFREWSGKIDILTGGFPCQPFSCAGKRKGQDDDRYLWPEMLRAIREIRPTWVIGENVGGIVSMVQPGSEVEVEHQAAFFETTDKETVLEQEFVVETVCRDLEHEGYAVQPIIIPACAVGAPHRRDRIWFVANRADTRTKSVQRERTIGICKAITIAHPDGERCHHRCDNWKERHIYYDKERHSTKNQSERVERECRAGKNCSTAPYPDCERRRQIFKEVQPSQSNGNRAHSVGDERDVADSESEQSQCMQPEQFKNRKQEQRQSGGSSSQDCGRERFGHWQNFPTQSPVCSGDDGFSSRLDGITFPKWRAESVKEYGNAIVPQVAFEIFKAIQNVTNTI